MNFQGQHGRTPLHKAAEKAFPVLIKALCEARADPDSRDHFGILLANWTFCHDPLWKPFLPDLAEMVENMFKTCDRPVARDLGQGETPLHVLAKSGHDEAISKSRRCEAIQMPGPTSGHEPRRWRSFDRWSGRRV